MITKNSLDLTKINDPCFALIENAVATGCRVLMTLDENCGTYKCPFYKPKDCKGWVRIDDRTGVNIIPPEEAFGRRKK